MPIERIQTKTGGEILRLRDYRGSIVITIHQGGWIEVELEKVDSWDNFTVLDGSVTLEPEEVQQLKEFL